MTVFGLKQIGLAVCVMASLLVGSASACMCSHHQVRKQAVKTSCHGVSHETAVAGDKRTAGKAFDVDCTCRVNQPTPVVISKTEEKRSKAEKKIAGEPVPARVELLETAAAHATDVPPFYEGPTYSYTLASLLPSRAPPRL